MIFNKALIILNKALIITLATCTAAVSLLAAPPDAGAPASKDVVVEVNGLKLTMTDLEQKRASALFQARTSYYEAERKVIEEVVDQTLLEQAAKTENVTLDELLKRHADSTIAPDPTEETLLVYYEGVDTTDPYEAVKTKIVDALRQRRIAKARQAYVQSLRSQGPIVMRLAPPRAPVSMKDVPVRGPANASGVC